MTSHRHTLAAAVLLALSPGIANAASTIKSPIVTKGEAEIEIQSSVTDDKDKSKDGEYETKLGLGYGVTDHWFVELESEWKRDPEDRFRHEAVAIENRFQILPQGEYLLDLGFYTEYEIGTRKGSTDEITLGPIFRSDIGKFRITANPFMSVEIGANSTEAPSFKYGVQGLYMLHHAFAPGIEMFGKTGELVESKRLPDQEHQIGPVLTGTILGSTIGLPGKFGYEAGVLFGLTRATADETYKIKLEYEFTF